MIARWPWLLVYAAACAVEFFAEWAKHIAAKRLKGEDDEEDDEPEVGE